jgi:hypothetical protein
LYELELDGAVLLAADPFAFTEPETDVLLL